MPAGEDPSEGFTGPGGAADSPSRGGPTGPGGDGGGIPGFNARFNNFMNNNPATLVPGGLALGIGGGIAHGLAGMFGVDLGPVNPAPGSEGGPTVRPPARAPAARPQDPMMDDPARGVLAKMRARAPQGRAQPRARLPVRRLGIPRGSLRSLKP